MRPVHCHCLSLDLKGLPKEPVGQGVAVDGERAETAHGLRDAPRGHGDPVLGFADINACGAGVADLEGLSEDG